MVYLFPGLEDSSDVVTILQPVLGWNSDYANAWSIASWNCCASGTVWEGTPAAVSSGDVIWGVISNTCSAGTLSCATWNIAAFDMTGTGFSVLFNTSSQGQTFNWAFGGVLEVYNVANCGDYPYGGSISFYDEGLWDYNLEYIANPAWKVTKLSKGLTPQCGYGGSLPKQVDLTY